MKQPRLCMSKIINGVMFNIESLENREGRHIFKLLSKIKKGKCYVTCKYKECNELSGIKDGIPTYTPIKYTQSVQIKDINSRGDIVIYEILSFSDYFRTSEINAIYNDQTYNLAVGGIEFGEFENFLKDLMPKLDDFSRSFINCTLEGILTKEQTQQTPDCIKDIVNVINDKTNHYLKK